MELPTPTADPAPVLPECATASLEEIRYAEQLRREIERRYLARAERPSDPYWCVGAD